MQGKKLLTNYDKSSNLKSQLVIFIIRFRQSNLIIIVGSEL